ncbi:hypothetical protein Desor_0596 [Desulfosporosinus orientis DSM 765]|uniref:DUF4179 domain-containing protein n=1 Tax=Desulfosporosinus orientis (strain ATCC 19365 / DSM 765 / NCIMB 8382 / VKM B-1628 / Singapore I) TaxID=768706 RepID=G7WCH5_DESOD|nr:DUF4179 domain-containing protein [Desulfosporosinus orientis]AET66297.1 hypothetical protein Desor_0596 [Desulfosporosinus orientis DSM 765]
MKSIEDILKSKKLEIEEIQVPEELEGRLREALETREQSRPGKGLKVYASAMIIIIAMLFSFNYDVIAFYSKQILGYDQIMTASLKQLSELGKGQAIGKKYEFKDGISLTLDYVMLDENQLLLFYTLKDPSGHVDENKISPFMFLKAFWGRYDFQNSQGEINEDKTEMKYIASFEPPLPFEKNLTLHFAEMEPGKEEEAEISFTLNRNTAMGHTLKKSLDAQIQVDNNVIKLDSILASPTKTVISGTIQNIFELVKDQLSGERIRPTELVLKLVADGKEVQIQGSGMSTDIKGITFHEDFDPLPENFEHLQLEVVRFGGDHDVNQQFVLNNKGEKQTLTILGQKVEIDKIVTSQNKTEITISSDDSLRLSKVYLMIDGKKVSLEQTLMDKYDKLPDGRIIHTRTLEFLGSGDQLGLNVQRMTYSKNYDLIFEIPAK